MLDLSGLSEQQQQSVLRAFEVAADNPLEMMKMDFLMHALTFKEWVEKNANVDRKQLDMMWQGVEAAVNRTFAETQKQLSKRYGIPILQ